MRKKRWLSILALALTVIGSCTLGGCNQAGGEHIESQESELKELLQFEKAEEENWCYVVVAPEVRASLTEIIIPKTYMGMPVKVIAPLAFWDCTSLVSVKIPNSVTVIAGSAFSGCTSLKRVSIPSSVTAIEFGTFSGCSSLTTIEIPDGVTTIAEGAFLGCSSLRGIEIPDGVTTIAEEAFSGCSSLRGIEIPDGVITIGESAFSDCSSLTSVIIPDSVTMIGYKAFYNCSSLTSVYYKGTEREWNNISIGYVNNRLINATRYYYDESETVENWWHYDGNGEIVHKQ